MNPDEYEIEFPGLGYEVLTRHNTALFNFIGESALLGPHKVYNHVFVYENQGEEDEYCLYIFQDNEMYADIEKHIKKHNFPQHLNLPTVAEIDQNAFEYTHGGGSDNFVPEGWEDGDGTAQEG